MLSYNHNIRYIRDTKCCFPFLFLKLSSFGIDDTTPSSSSFKLHLCVCSVALSFSLCPWHPNQQASFTVWNEAHPLSSHLSGILLRYPTFTSNSTNLKANVSFFPQRSPSSLFNISSLCISAKSSSLTLLSFIFLISYLVTKSYKLSKYLFCLSLPQRASILPLPYFQILKSQCLLDKMQVSQSNVCTLPKLALFLRMCTSRWFSNKHAHQYLGPPTPWRSSCLQFLASSFSCVHSLTSKCKHLMKQLLTIPALHVCVLPQIFTACFSSITHCPALLFNSLRLYV